MSQLIFKILLLVLMPCVYLQIIKFDGRTGTYIYVNTAKITETIVKNKTIHNADPSPIPIGAALPAVLAAILAASCRPAFE